MNAEVGKCRGCGKAILWVKNENGKNEPFDFKHARVLRVDGDPYPGMGTFYEGTTKGYEIIVAHLPHFVTCPKAGDFHK